MKEIETLLAKRKQLKDQVASLESTIEGIDSIRQRVPYIGQMSDLEGQIADLEDEITKHIGSLINNVDPMTLKIEVNIRPSEYDVEFEIDDLENVTDLQELLKTGYTTIIEDNFYSLIYGKVSDIKVK